MSSSGAGVTAEALMLLWISSLRTCSSSVAGTFRMDLGWMWESLVCGIQPGSKLGSYICLKQLNWPMLDCGWGKYQVGVAFEIVSPCPTLGRPRVEVRCHLGTC